MSELSGSPGYERALPSAPAKLPVCVREATSATLSVGASHSRRASLLCDSDARLA
jgi:hypothetical protein